jgi:hypothetical protein
MNAGQQTRTPKVLREQGDGGVEFDFHDRE